MKNFTIKSKQEQYNELVGIIIDNYDGVERLTIKGIRDIFEKEYKHNITYNMLDYYMNEGNRIKLKDKNEGKPVVSNEQLNEFVAKYIQNISSNKRIVYQEMALKANSEGIECLRHQVFYGISKENKRLIKEHNKRLLYKYSILPQDDYIKLFPNSKFIRVNHYYVEAFEQEKEYRSRVLNLLMNEQLDLVSWNGQLNRKTPLYLFTRKHSSEVREKWLKENSNYNFAIFYRKNKGRPIDESIRRLPSV